MRLTLASPQIRQLTAICKQALGRDSCEVKAFDYEDMLALAQQQGVGALFWQYCEMYPDLFTSDELVDIHTQRRAVKQVNRLQAFETIRLLEEFASESISLVPFKGVVLNLLGYGGLACRESGDLDFYVSPSQFNAAVRHFQRLGYSLERELSDAQITAMTRSQSAVELFSPTYGLIVELHCSLLYEWRCSATCESWENQLATRIFLDTQIQVLKPEARFVVLALHGSKHQFNKLRFLFDLLVVYPENHEEYEKIKLLSRKLGVETLVTNVFALLGELGCRHYSTQRGHSVWSRSISLDGQDQDSYLKITRNLIRQSLVMDGWGVILKRWKYRILQPRMQDLTNVQVAKRSIFFIVTMRVIRLLFSIVFCGIEKSRQILLQGRKDTGIS